MVCSLRWRGKRERIERQKPSLCTCFPFICAFGRICFCVSILRSININVDMSVFIDVCAYQCVWAGVSMCECVECKLLLVRASLFDIIA